MLVFVELTPRSINSRRLFDFPSQRSSRQASGVLTSVL
jgi:hypothetical protein